MTSKLPKQNKEELTASCFAPDRSRHPVILNRLKILICHRIHSIGLQQTLLNLTRHPNLSNKTLNNKYNPISKFRSILSRHQERNTHFLPWPRVQMKWNTKFCQSIFVIEYGSLKRMSMERWKNLWTLHDGSILMQNLWSSRSSPQTAYIVVPINY